MQLAHESIIPLSGIVSGTSDLIRWSASEKFMAAMAAAKWHAVMVVALVTLATGYTYAGMYGVYKQ